MSALFLSLLALSPAFADNCSEKDYREELGIPRMQDGSSWCYANSAADLISQAVGNRISAIDLAITFLLGDEKKLKKVKSKKLQEYLKLHSDFDAKLWESRKEEEAYQPEHFLSSSGIVDTGGMDDEAIVLSNIKGLCLAANLPAGEENLNKYLTAIREDYANEDKDLPLGPIGAVENDVAKIMAHAFRNWVDQKCGARIHPKEAFVPAEASVADTLEEYNKLVTQGVVNPDKARATLIEELDRVLDSGKVAAIAYESYDLYPKADGHSGRGDHSSVVAARKKVDGKCHYFVRNHFGATCGYRPEFESHCEKEHGGVWVQADALKHLYSVISVR